MLDVSGQKQSRGSAGQASEPTSAEAHNPSGDVRRPAELIERDTEQERAEEPGAKADAGIEPDRMDCRFLPRDRHFGESEPPLLD